MLDIEICLGGICSTSPPLNKRGLMLALRSFISRLETLTRGIILLKFPAIFYLKQIIKEHISWQHLIPR